MTNQSQFKTLFYSREGSVLTITLNRPEKLNAFNQDMIDDLGKVLEGVSNDPNTSVIVFTGAGRAFCSGADLGHMAERQADAETETSQNLKKLQGLFDLVEAMPKPTIAAMNGHAIGAGLQLALACDFRIVVENAKIGFPDVKNGIIPALGATTRLPPLIGLAKTKELILTGELISPEKALEMGLVNGVVHSDNLDQTVQELSEKLTLCAPLAVAAAKELLNSGASMDAVAAAQIRLIQTADAKEGIKAFLEKRKPSFIGS